MRVESRASVIQTIEAMQPEMGLRIDHLSRLLCSNRERSVLTGGDRRLMRNGSTDVPLPLRRQWLGSLVDRLQAAHGHVAILERTDAREFLLSLAQSIPTPCSWVDKLIARALLLEFAAETGNVLHQQVHTGNSGKGCAFVPCLLLNTLWKRDIVDPVAAFRGWVETYCAGLNQAHPTTVAERVALLLRCDLRRPWSIASLARRAGATDTQVKRAFKREYGMSTGDYLRRVRLVAAIERLRQGEKIEAVALDVGYRSKKFYVAFRRFTGMRPAEIRRLSHHAAAQMLDGARLALRARSHDVSRVRSTRLSEPRSRSTVGT